MRKTSSGSVWCTGLVSIALGTALGTALAAQEPPAKSTFTEVLDVDLVNVDVVVTDKNGNLVTDLTRDDFQIVDDGKKVEIGYFARLGAGAPAGAESAPGAAGSAGARPGGAAAQPRHLAIFVDLDNLLPHGRNRVLGELRGRLSSMAAEDDLRVMVASFGPQGLDVELPFSPSPAEWTATLTEVEAMPGRGALRNAQQRRLVENVDQVLRLAENKQTMQTARDRLDELVGSVRIESEAMRANALMTIRAIQTLASVLSTVPGQKSLLYVGDGMPIRPGQDLQDLLADVFESDRRFGQSGGPVVLSANPGSSAPGGDDSTAGGGAQGGGLGGVDSSDFVSPMAQSTGTLRLDGMSVDLTADLRALTATANSHRVTLYGVSTDAPGGTARADYNIGARTSAGVALSYDTSRSQLLEQSLHFMADETGGLVLPASSGVEDFLGRVLSDQENRYSLAYASPHGGDARFHPIKVKVNRKGVRLRHREGYIDRPREVRVGDLVAGALFLGAGENPHQMQMELLSQEPATGDDMQVSLGLRIPIDQLRLENAGATHQAKLDLYVLSKDGGGALQPMRYVAVTVEIPSDRMADAAGQFYGATLPLSLKKGPHKVAVGVVEPAVQRTSVVRLELEAGD